MQNPFQYFSRHLERVQLFTVKTPTVFRMGYPGKAAEFYDTLERSRIPFTLEAAVHNFGKEIAWYMAMPISVYPLIEHNLKKALPGTEMYAMHDYNLFSVGHAVEAGYLVPKNKTTEASGEMTAFSRMAKELSTVELLGESASFQVISKPEKRGSAMNMRLVTSANTPFRAREVFDTAAQSFKNFKAVRVKNEDFIDQFSYHIFEPKQKVVLQGGELSQIFHF
ncbi:MAG: hypothetical protein AAB407_03110 [Patescibacteria group bacterium]